MTDNVEHPANSSSPQQFRSFPERDQQTPKTVAPVPDSKQFRAPIPAQPALPDESQAASSSEEQSAILPVNQPTRTFSGQFAPLSFSQVEQPIYDPTTIRNGEQPGSQADQSIADLTTLRDGTNGNNGNKEQVRPMLKLPARPTLKSKTRQTPEENQNQAEAIPPMHVSQMPTMPVASIPVEALPMLPTTPMPAIPTTPPAVNIPTTSLSHVQETRTPYTTLESPEQLSTINPQRSEIFSSSLPNTPHPSASHQRLGMPPTTQVELPTLNPSSPAELHLQEQAQRYAQWLAKQADNEKRDTQAEIDAYRKEATVLVKVDDKEIAPFAPFRPELSALQTFTRPQVITLCILSVCATGAEVVFKLAALTAVVSTITVIYTLCLLLNLFMAFKAFRANPEERIDDEIIHRLKHAEWPMYTILCPLYKEAQVVPQFVQAMQALDYPQEKLQILFLTEEHDRETRAAIRALSLPGHFQILVVPDGMPRTKPRACNYGLLHATGSYTVIYDAEDIPDPLQLKKAILAFANSDLQTVCVQAKLNFYNSTQNLLTRWFTAEYSTWFSFILPGLQAANFVIPLGGTSNHFRTASLRGLGGWDAYNVTEDCDLGLRLKRFQMKTVILDSTTLEEANPNLKNWLRQRSRWIKGYMQTYLVHMRTPLKTLREGKAFDFFSFQVVVGSGTGMLFFNPLMWCLLILYAVFGPKVIAIYHILFPGPVLYLGAFCLIFGNFFYLYLYLLACAKRKAYNLIFWSLFIPIYWLLMSIAGIYAFVELLLKPHYWQKTVHGLHLQGQAQAHTPQQAAAFVKQHTQNVPAIRAIPQQNANVVLRTITTAMKAISTLPVPVVSVQQKRAAQVAKQAKVRDLWLYATMIVSCITGILACWYYFEKQELIFYGDSVSHMRIARSVFDSATPGLAQLGTVWLPLPHILMWPFIWNDFLWRTGLAGSFVSMPCYVITAIYIFHMARQLTKSSFAAFIASFIFIANPTVLYLQTTPLSETVCMATLAMSAYYFLRWVQKDQLIFLLITSFCTFLSSLARYDGWAIFAALMVFVPFINILRHKKLHRIIGESILFLILGGLGIILWLIWNLMLFGDPFYFKNNIYSSAAQQSQLLKAGQLPTYHNLWQALLYYTVDTQQIGGTILCILAILGLFWFVANKRKSFDSIAVLILLVPFAFYVVALYTGQASIWIAGVNPPGIPSAYFNVRYGAQMVAPLSILIVLPLTRFSPISPKNLRNMIRFLLLLTIVVQYSFAFSQGTIVLKETIDTTDVCTPISGSSLYLAQHYNSGYILEYMYTSKIDASSVGLDFKYFIWEASNDLWKNALKNPANTVTWILVNPTNNQDLIAQHINVHDTTFLSKFTLVATQSNGIELYHRLGQPLTPIHPAPQQWNIPRDMCP